MHFTYSNFIAPYTKWRVKYRKLLLTVMLYSLVILGTIGVISTTMHKLDEPKPKEYFHIVSMQTFSYDGKTRHIFCIQPIDGNSTYIAVEGFGIIYQKCSIAKNK